MTESLLDLADEYDFPRLAFLRLPSRRSCVFRPGQFHLPAER